MTPQEACKWIVGVLRIAANASDEKQKQHEQALGERLLKQALSDQLPSLKKIQSHYLQNQQNEVTLLTTQHDIALYDQLLSQPLIAQQEGELPCH
jgi:hypothetical protein